MSSPRETIATEQKELDEIKKEKPRVSVASQTLSNDKIASLKTLDEKPGTPVANNEASSSSDNLNGKASGYLIYCLCIAVIGSSFQFGWNIALYNTPYDVVRGFFEEVHYERTNEPLSDGRFTLLWSITNGLNPLGGIFGGLACGIVADYFGRRKALWFTNLFVVLSAVLNIISKFVKSYETIMIGRFFSGVLCGLFSGITPMYLNELPPQNLKGAAGTLNQLTVVLGIVIVNILGLPQVFGTSSLWPVLVGFMLVPGLSQLGLLAAVESPKYLYINRNDAEGARKVLTRLRGEENSALIENELKQLEAEKQQKMSQKNINWSDFYKVKVLFRPLIIACFVQLSQQLSGINAVMFYSTSIFKSVGLEGQWPIYATIVLNAVQFIMTLVCLFIIDRAGRRILLIVGMIGMCIFAFLLSITRVLASEERNWLNYITLVSAVAYIIAFSIGPGPIPWLLTSELFASDARGKASSFAVFTNWFSNFIVTVSFPFIEAAIKEYSFIIFGALLILISILMILIIPETKNKSIEQVQAGFARGFFVFSRTKVDPINNKKENEAD